MKRREWTHFGIQFGPSSVLSAISTVNSFSPFFYADVLPVYSAFSVVNRFTIHHCTVHLDQAFHTLPPAAQR